MKQEYSKESALKKLEANKDCRIVGTWIIFELPGLKYLGAIDYLVGKHGYAWFKELGK